MIYFTGDTHGDKNRLSKFALKQLKSGDTLIVCGDFGFLWDESKKEKKFLEKLSKRNYNICFIDGTHENFELLEKIPVTFWRGGRVRKITDNVIHLMRGEIYEIDKKIIFTMGGGESPEIEYKNEEDLTHQYELPTKQEMLNGVNNLERCEFKVDYIVTHEPPAKIRDFLLLSKNTAARTTALGAYFDELSVQASFERWFFGSMHMDKFISNSQIAVFNNIVSSQTGMKI